MNETLTVPRDNRILSVAEMQALERAADAAGHSYAAMMEAAGQAVAHAVMARYGTAPVLVLAGPGNNGGDGLVCARHLHQSGVPVCVYLWQRPTTPEGDTHGHLARLGQLGVPVAAAGDDPAALQLGAWLGQANVIVDALLGTGANRPITGQLAAILDAAHATRQRAGHAVVAVDCASGLNCDTGAVDDRALTPDLTVTFAYAKHGHYQFPGAAYVGDLCVVDIGIPAHLAPDAPVFVLDEALIRAWLPPRPAASHKGTYGKLLLAVGSENFPGAASLACAAGGRVGAGLVTGAIPRTIWPIAAARLAEATWLPLPVQETGEQAGLIDGAAAAALVTQALPAYDALVLGCGLGHNPATRTFVQAVLAAQPAAATLIDADGLNCLAQLPTWPKVPLTDVRGSERDPSPLPPRCVLTPHPAEMARLCACTPAEVTARRWALARRMAAAWQCVVLLKGPYTVVAHPHGQLAVLPIATAALATAGTGDVLAGAIGGLLAQGLEPFVAACVGAWLHGAAGLRVAQAVGSMGALASDLLPHLPGVIAAMQRHATAPTGHHQPPPTPGPDVAGVVAM